MDFGNTRDETFDHAAIEAARAQGFAALVGAIQELAKEGNELRYQATLANYISLQISQLQLEHAKSLAHLQSRLIDLYEYSADRRYGAGWVKRLFTAGSSAGGDAEMAAAGALAEMERVRDAMDALRERQMRDAILSRLPLFRAIAGSRKGGLLAAMRVLQVVAPKEYAKIVDATEPAIGDEEAP
jgi:hypothetical protein